MAGPLLHAAQLALVVLLVVASISLGDAQVDDNSSRLYWADCGRGTIRRAALDGSGVEDLIVCGAQARVRGVAIDDALGQIYWSELGTRAIRRANLDGSNAEVFVYTYRGPEGLAIDGVSRKIYFTDIEGRVQRADLDYDPVQVEGIVPPAFVQREGIAVAPSSGLIFWTNSEVGFGSVSQASEDGGDAVDLVTSDDDLGMPGQQWRSVLGPRAIAVHAEAGKIYWSDITSDCICRADFDGSNIEVIVSTGLHSPMGIAIDGARGKMYWLDRGNSTLNSNLDALSVADLDGSDRQILQVYGHMEPRSIAIGAAA